MNLSDHFTLAEFTLSQTATRKGLDNTPSPAVSENLKLVANKLEAIRAFLHEPIIVSSGYRSPAVNKSIGGVATSAHCMGYAVDFICPNYGSPLQVATRISVSGLKWDQLIEEGGWVHISVDPRMRQQVLTMRKGRYTTGLTG